MTTNAPAASLAELLCTLSFVSDLGLPAEDEQAIFYGALLKDAGCTACAAVIATFFAGDDVGARSDCFLLRPDNIQDGVSWFWRHAPADPGLPTRIGKLFSFLVECRGVMKESMAAHCEVGEMFTRRLGLPESVQATVRYSWESWDGKGLAYGLKGADVPLTARVLHLAQTVEAASYFGARAAAEAIAKERSGKGLDPEVANAFLRLCGRKGFWDLLEKEPIQATVLATNPEASFDRLPPEGIDDVCEVLADFADVKSRVTWNHSLEVATVASEIAASMGVSSADSALLRRAALVHDLGKAAIPVGILDKDHEHTSAEKERFELHPHYTEEVLSRIGPLAELAPVAGAHHERPDGLGYHRRLNAEAIPLGARIIAVADAYSRFSRGSADPEQALAAIAP